MTTQGSSNRSTSKFLRLEISNIIYLFQYYHFWVGKHKIKHWCQVNIERHLWKIWKLSLFINVMVFCCEIHWMKVWKTPDVGVSGGAACSHKSFHRGRENSSVDQKWWIHLLVVPMFQGPFIISGIRDWVTAEFRKNNERFSDPSYWW